MQSKRYREKTILEVLKGAESKDTTILQVCRDYGINTKTYYRWKKPYGGVEDVSALKERKRLHEENRRLKKRVAEQAMDIDLLKELNAKKWSR